MEAALPANSRRSTQTVSGEHEAGVARPLAMARILLGIQLGRFPPSPGPICVHLRISEPR
jgi:hypothetical protein